MLVPLTALDLFPLRVIFTSNRRSDHDEMATLSAYALLTCYHLLCHGFMRYDVDLEISSAPRVSSLVNRLWVHICSNFPAGLAGIIEKLN